MSAAPHPTGAEIAPEYEVIDHLSRGRSLDVYDVWSWERGARVVAKALRPELRNDERSRRRLRREGRLLRELCHPHIVRGYETLERPETVVVMETLRGETLAHLIEEGVGALGAADLSQLGLQLGSAIRFLHSREVLHLDLKPSNVVAEAGSAKLIDLSVARPPGPVDAGVGTWCYMAPEQARGGTVDSAADVWGLGAVLFEAATGRPAFYDPDWMEDHSDSSGPELWESGSSDPRRTGDGESPEYPQLVRRAARADEVADVPRDLVDLLAGCLDPEPRRRPTLGAVLRDLERAGDLPPAERRWERPPAEAKQSPERTALSAAWTGS